jgi:hypothetical protein
MIHRGAYQVCNQSPDYPISNDLVVERAPTINEQAGISC